MIVPIPLPIILGFILRPFRFETHAVAVPEQFITHPESDKAISQKSRQIEFIFRLRIIRCAVQGLFNFAGLDIHHFDIEHEKRIQLRVRADKKILRIGYFPELHGAFNICRARVLKVLFLQNFSDMIPIHHVKFSRYVSANNH